MAIIRCQSCRTAFPDTWASCPKCNWDEWRSPGSDEATGPPEAAPQTTVAEASPGTDDTRSSTAETGVMLLNSFRCPNCATPFPLFMGPSRWFFREAILFRRGYICSNCGAASIPKTCWRDAFWAWPAAIWFLVCSVRLWEKASLLLPLPLAVRFAVAVILLLVVGIGIRRGFRLTPLPDREAVPSMAVRRARSLALFFVVLVVVVLFRSVFPIYRVKTDVLAPDIRRGSHLLVSHLAREFTPGDVVVYRRGERRILARVVAVNGQTGEIRVERKGEGIEKMPRSRIVGRCLAKLW